MIKVTLKDGSVKEIESPLSAFDVAKEISPRLAKAACVARINDEIKDLRTVIDNDCTLEILTFDDEDGKKGVQTHCLPYHGAGCKKTLPRCKARYRSCY